MSHPPITATAWRIGPPRMVGQIEVRMMKGLPWPTIRYGVYRAEATTVNGVDAYYETLNKSGEWEHEPIPSSRDDDYIARCRWNNWEDAATAAIRAYETQEER